MVYWFSLFVIKKSSDFRFLETEDSGFGCKRVQKTNHSPTERFSVSVCGNPLKRQPLLFSCPLTSVEPRVISPCGHQRCERQTLHLRLSVCVRKREFCKRGRFFHNFVL